SIPLDWYIVITDVIGSTKAIEAGKYKDVNYLGASSIVAVLNIADKLEIPFVFGGDGASLAIPPSLYLATKKALLGLRKLAKEEYDLDLRVGAVPIEEVIRAGYEVKIAKWRVSKNYSQAVFIGGGLTYATELIKSSVNSHLYQYSCSNTDFSHNEVSLEGLECRWQDIFSKSGETISLIVQSTDRNFDSSHQVYRNFLKKVYKLYGIQNDYHPVTKETLNLSFSYRNLRSEVNSRTQGQGGLHKGLCFLKLAFINALGWLLMKFEPRLGDMDWGKYKDILLATSDYQKFDDMLRMVIASNSSKRKQLVKYLEKQFRAGKLVYGIHKSDRALMTCLVFERNGKQVHFVDGADGGYTLAAKAMKQKIESQSLMANY
ncbi:MAG: DUF3095 domain-containing protein, partial [Spirulinaceae cyanobacterium]